MGYTWEAIHRVSLLVTLLPLKLPTIWNRARPMGLPENHKLSKVEYTDTQQDLPDKKKKIQLDMQGFLAVVFVLPKATKS
jgi:hypothetical protein